MQQAELAIVSAKNGLSARRQSFFMEFERKKRGVIFAALNHFYA